MAKVLTFKMAGNEYCAAYSSDEQQIRELMAKEIADNVKKGWEEVGD